MCLKVVDTRRADARRAILTLRAKTKALSGVDLSPDWYIFPHSEGNSKPDPTRPMSSWRTAWRSITKKAGLAGLRFHDLRHHAITELAESSTSEQTIMSIAGHVSARMLAHYSHVRLEAKRTAVSVLCNTGEKGVTSQTTSQARTSGECEDLNSLKNMVDVTGIEPATPCLQSVRQGYDSEYYDQLSSTIESMFMRHKVAGSCIGMTMDCYSQLPRCAPNCAPNP
jgi:hypothetical protein